MEIRWIIFSIAGLLFLALFFFIWKMFHRKKVVEVYKDGKLKRVYYLLRKKKDGEELVYYPTGELNKKRKWKNDLPQGNFIIYFKNGKTYITGIYHDGKYTGDYTIYDIEGKIIQTIKY